MLHTPSHSSPPPTSPITTRHLLLLVPLPLASTLLALQTQSISSFSLIIINVHVDIPRGEARRIDVVGRAAELLSADGRPMFEILRSCDGECLQIEFRRGQRLRGEVGLRGRTASVRGGRSTGQHSLECLKDPNLEIDRAQCS